jgi:hypothetical protein
MLVKLTTGEQVSISHTFYARLFGAKVSREAFLNLHFRFVPFFGARILARMRLKNVGEIDITRAVVMTMLTCTINFTDRD